MNTVEIKGELYFVFLVTRYRELFSDDKNREITEELYREELQAAGLQPVHVECAGFVSLFGVKIPLKQSINEIAYVIRKIGKKALTECKADALQHMYQKPFFVSTHCPTGTELVKYITDRIEETKNAREKDDE